jgi:hypothetical protein
MDVTWEGVVIIWAGFLWPMLVTIAYLLIKGRKISDKGKCFVISTAVGYVVFVIANVLFSLLVQVFIDTDKITKNSQDFELLASSLVLFSVIFFLAPPIISSHILYKRNS